MGNVTNMLGGRVAGVVALQQSGQPGSDGASILVRGSGAKYIVDGVARDFSQIDPNDIESVSVLKDASSAAIYGMDASAVIIDQKGQGRSGQDLLHRHFRFEPECRNARNARRSGVCLLV